MSSSVPFALRGSYRGASLTNKDVDVAAMERDAGFCSGGDDEELDDLHSPTDASEDSVEVKVEPICLRNKNKRKCAEPRKVANEETQPYKKRRHFIQETTLSLQDERYLVKTTKKSPLLVKEEVCPRVSVSPFRPWSHARSPSLDKPCTQVSPPPAQCIQFSPAPAQCTQVSPPPAQYTERVPALPDQEEPLSLVLRSPSKSRDGRCSPETSSFNPKLVIKSEFPNVPARLADDGDERRQESATKRLSYLITDLKEEPGTSTRTAEDDYRLQRVEAVDFTMAAGPSRLPDLPRGRRTLSEMANEDRVVCSAEDLSSMSPAKYNPHPSTSSTSSDKKNSPGGSNQQRNYKNMTRERRVEANARERTRVHTISAAFDTLRRTIPAYSHNQKLSKLSVLRIACSYILTLSRVAGSDYSADSSEPSLADCVDYVTRTIQTEGKLRKKKED